ncbi:hypothetical protein Q9966_007332 [Columba livia]|nr:hypothetical protein Q9966_007332 [Columba livia]
MRPPEHTKQRTRNYKLRRNFLKFSVPMEYRKEGTLRNAHDKQRVPVIHMDYSILGLRSQDGSRHRDCLVSAFGCSCGQGGSLPSPSTL